MDLKSEVTMLLVGTDTQIGELKNVHNIYIVGIHNYMYY